MKTFKKFFIEKEEKRRLDPKCWKGYRKAGTKLKGGVRVNKCVKVKEDAPSRPVLNTIEEVYVDGIGVLRAKVDSGNEAYNVLHGIDIKNNGNTITFKTVGDKELTGTVKELITIHIGSGVKEKRPVIELNIRMHEKDYANVPFSIADRSENEEPILIGEPFLKKIDALIDVNNN